MAIGPEESDGSLPPSISTELAGLRIGAWSDVEPRIMVRAVPAVRAGPAARPLTPDLRLDVGIDLADGIAVPSITHVARWAVDAEQVWRTACSNTRRSVHPVSQRLPASPGGSIDGLDVVAVTVGPWTTGILIDIGHFLPWAVPAAPGIGQPATAAWLAAPNDGLVVVVQATIGPGEASTARVERLAGSVLDGLFDRRLGIGQDRLPPNRFAVESSGRLRDLS